MSTKQRDILKNELRNLDRDTYMVTKNQIFKKPMAEQITILKKAIDDVNNLKQREKQEQLKREQQIIEKDQLVQQLISLNPTTYADNKDLFDDDDYETQIENLKILIDDEITKQNIIPPQTHTESSLVQTKHTNMQDNEIFEAPNINTTERTYKTRKGTGMKDVMGVILDLKQDFKRVEQALSLPGANKIVYSHNKNAAPGNEWILKTDDVNNDGFPDMIIRNKNTEEPIIVNGWTTKPSDYPLRVRYYNSDLYTSGLPYKQYKYNVLERTPGFYNDLRGHNYGINTPLTKEKREKAGEAFKNSTYTKFRRFFDAQAEPIIQAAEQEDSGIPLYNGKMARKTACLSTVCGMLWDKLIMNPLRERWLSQVPTSDIDTEHKRVKVFNKLRKSDAGKAKIAAFVDNAIEYFSQKQGEFKGEIADGIINYYGKPKGLGESINQIVGNRNQQLLSETMFKSGYQPREYQPADEDYFSFKSSANPSRLVASGDTSMTMSQLE